MSAEVSEEHIVSIFTVKEYGKKQTGMKQAANRALCLIFDPQDGGDMFLRNSGKVSSDYTALYKIKTFVVTGARNSNPTYTYIYISVCSFYNEYISISENTAPHNWMIMNNVAERI
jgi:hypothetical protein